MRSALYEGTLLHARTLPTRNVFTYPVCFYGLDLDELPELDRRLALFGYNRANVLTFRDGDHLGDPDLPVKANVVAFLAERGIALDGGRVVLLTNLRLLGHVFNPVSYFYCYRPDGELAAIVAEVSNTFGERHPYLLTRRQPGAGRRTAGVRAPQADARLAVLRHGPDLPVLVHRARRSACTPGWASWRATSARSGPSSPAAGARSPTPPSPGR